MGWFAAGPLQEMSMGLAPSVNQQREMLWMYLIRIAWRSQRIYTLGRFAGFFILSTLV